MPERSAAPHRSQRARQPLLRSLAVVAVLALLATQSWLTHVEQMQQRLRLEAIETVQMADTLAYQAWRMQPRPPPGYDFASLRAPLESRLRHSTGFCLLRGPDGTLLLQRGPPLGPPLLAAAGEPLWTAWLEGRSHSPLTGMSSVSALDLEGTLATWAASIALPAALLLGSGVLVLTVFGRLENVRSDLRCAKRNALRDTLTGLPNRRAFDTTFAALGRASVRDKRPLSALFIDIDRFKQLNDHHGHAAGDRALRAVAGAIRGSLLRPVDFCCRWGGEEFVVLLPDTDARGALQTAQRVMERVHGLRIRLLDGREQRITVSVGVATHADHGSPGLDLVIRADHAMLEAKRAGRDRWMVWREPMSDHCTRPGSDQATAVPVHPPAAPLRRIPDHPARS